MSIHFLDRADIFYEGISAIFSRKVILMMAGLENVGSTGYRLSEVALQIIISTILLLFSHNRQ